MKMSIQEIYNKIDEFYSNTCKTCMNLNPPRSSEDEGSIGVCDSLSEPDEITSLNLTIEGEDILCGFECSQYKRKG